MDSSTFTRLATADVFIEYAEHRYLSDVLRTEWPYRVTEKWNMKYPEARWACAEIVPACEHRRSVATAWACDGQSARGDLCDSLTALGAFAHCAGQHAAHSQVRS